MPAWQEAMAVALFEFTTTLPRVEDFGLTSQIRRSSNSVPANIAEAFGRFHRANKLNFYYNTRGSLCETMGHVHYAAAVGYMEAPMKTDFDDQLDSVWKQLNSIVNNLRQQRG